jgi:diguanylate cyclase (GGDEF)-like protein
MRARMPHVSVLLLALGISSLCFAVALLRIDRNEEVNLKGQALAYQADDGAGRVGDYLGRVESVLGTVAASAPVQRLAAGGPTSRADRRDSATLLLHVHEVFAGATGEASLLELDGRKLADTVNGRPVAIDPDAAVAPAPIRALLNNGLPGLQRTAPYKSPATGQWVIGYVAPVGRPLDPVGAAFVEITMQSLAWTLDAPDGHLLLSIVDPRSGQVLVDSRHPEREGPVADAPQALTLRGDAADAGRLARGDSLSAYQAMPHKAGGDEWVVVATMPDALAGKWWTPRGLPLTLGIAGIALFLLGLAGLRTSARRLERIARTDSLTGLPNRRALQADLHAVEQRATAQAPAALLILDLDGFKAYNDVFGHGAGDDLLVRLGARLRADLRAVDATAYRLGGDEFCVLGQGHEIQLLVEIAIAALSEQGDGFEISASCGAALLPTHAADAAGVLRLADQRMYAHKAGGRTSTGQQLTNVLSSVVAERDPLLQDHVDDVAKHAREVGARLGCDHEELTRIEQAAVLHDIGKMAIPDAILDKPGPLNQAETAFMRTHTMIGERMLAVAPALRAASKLVRWSHEAWDGSGYPDQLAGEDIPLGARIIAVCDAYSAMVSTRPYKAAMSSRAALDELMRCAGTQFDPRVVDVFISVVGHESADEPVLAKVA